MALAVVGWVAWGVHGTFSYGQEYLTYRGFPPPKDPPGVAPGRLVRVQFYSTALGVDRKFLVYKPPGYARAAAQGHRFPALYLLHGAPGSPRQFINVAAAGVALDQGLKDHTLRPFLLVMPDGTDGSWRRDTEWANTPHGQYETSVLETVNVVDHRFATLRSRAGRAIAGVSEGAYAALNLSLRHPGRFSIAEAWSGYAQQSRVGPFALASDSALLANSPAVYVPQIAPVLRRHPMHVYIYSGTHEKVAPKMQAFALELRAAGADVRFSIFHGGHDWELWRKETPRMLRYADLWFGRHRHVKTVRRLRHAGRLGLPHHRRHVRHARHARHLRPVRHLLRIGTGR
jgi:enterochelin esterase-like enzyme